MIHPPYLDIVKFTDKEEDLSNISDLESFIEKFKKAVSTCIQFLAKKKYFALSESVSISGYSSKWLVFVIVLRKTSLI